MLATDIPFQDGRVSRAYAAAVAGPSVSVVTATIMLMLFIALNPPFLYNPVSPEGIALRLCCEAAILLSLALYLATTHAHVWVALLFVFCLYVLNFVFSTEAIGNVLSHFNKLALLLLLPATFRKNRRLVLLCKKVWVGFWVYCIIAGLIGYMLVLSHLIPLVPVDVQIPGYQFYNYPFLPFLGNFLYKAADFVAIPRYCGYITEPVELGLFFGFNMIVSKVLVDSHEKHRWFFTLNLLGGLLTLSYIFGIFLVCYLALRIKWIARVASNKILVVVFVSIIIIGATTLVISMLGNGNVGALLPYSSASDRIERYVLSISFLQQASPRVLLFGAGILPFHEAIGKGASAGLLDVLASRGVILLLVWLYIIRANAKRIPGLFAYILLYSLVLDFWHFPLFIMGLAIVAAVTVRQRHDVEGSLAQSVAEVVA